MTHIFNHVNIILLIKFCLQIIIFILFLIITAIHNTWMFDSVYQVCSSEMTPSKTFSPITDQLVSKNISWITNKMYIKYKNGSQSQGC